MPFNEWKGNANDPEKKTVIHIGAELNISENVENIDNKTEVDIQCCCAKVCFSKIIN